MTDRDLSVDMPDGVPQVEVGKMDESEQCSSFLNATLQGSADQKWAVSIATYVTVPGGMTRAQAQTYVRDVLNSAAKGEPRIMFDAMVGPSFDYETIVAEETEAADRGEVSDDE